jgi:hypothetical protein
MATETDKQTKFISEVRRSRNNRLKQWKDDHIVIIGLDDEPDIKDRLHDLIDSELGITKTTS